MFEDLDTLSTVNLKKICKMDGIHGYSKLKKHDIVELIKIHRIELLVKEGLDALNKLC